MPREDRPPNARNVRLQGGYRVPSWECSAVTTGPENADGGDVLGNALRVTPGQPSRPASQGSVAVKDRSANGQSCLPVWETTAQSMPLARPSAHSE